MSKEPKPPTQPKGHYRSGLPSADACLGSDSEAESPLQSDERTSSDRADWSVSCQNRKQRRHV
jgi:hypothetical protein